MNPHERFIVHKDLNLARLPIPPHPQWELLGKNIALFSKRSRGGTTHSYIFLNTRLKSAPLPLPSEALTARRITRSSNRAKKSDVVRRRADESVAVLAGNPLVGFVGAVACEDFLFRVEGQQRANGNRVFFQVDAVLFEVLNRSVKRSEVVVERFDVLENFFRFCDGNLVVFAQIVARVRQMRDSGGEMSAAGGRVEAGGVAGNNGVEEVAEMVAAAVERFNRFEILVEDGRVRIARIADVSLGTVEDNADLAAFVLEERIGFFVVGIVDVQTAGFKDDALLSVVVNGDFRIGGVASVDVVRIFAFRLIAQTSAVSDNGIGVTIQTQAPASDVRLVRSLVAAVAVAVQTLPVPIVMELWTRNLGRCERRGTRPQIEIDGVGNGVVAQRADGSTAFIAESASEVDFADSAFFDELDHVDQPFAGTALGSDLADLVVLFHGGGNGSALSNVVADGFFNVDVFSRLHRPNGGKAVPVVRRSDRDAVDVFFLHDFSQISNENRTFARSFFNLIAAVVAGFFVAVADIGNLNVAASDVPVDVVAAASANADNRHRQFVVGAGFLLRQNRFWFNSRAGGNSSRGCEHAVF